MSPATAASPKTPWAPWKAATRDGLLSRSLSAHTASTRVGPSHRQSEVGFRFLHGTAAQSSHMRCAFISEGHVTFLPDLAWERLTRRHRAERSKPSCAPAPISFSALAAAPLTFLVRTTTVHFFCSSRARTVSLPCCPVAPVTTIFFADMFEAISSCELPRLPPCFLLSVRKDAGAYPPPDDASVMANASRTGASKVSPR